MGIYDRLDFADKNCDDFGAIIKDNYKRSQ
jgi:hypothetical protein